MAGGHLGYQYGMILAILNLYVTPMPPMKLEFQYGHRGSHLGNRNKTILAILNLHVATLPPIKFQLNPTCGSEGDVENVKR